MAVAIGAKLVPAAIVLVLLGAAPSHQDVTAGDQLIIFKNETQIPIGIMTTSNGAPVEYNDTETLNRNLNVNHFYIETITHFVRERLSERVVHAKGAGAMGYFKVTHDIKDICNAKLFNAVGKTTPVIVRFSPVFPSKGGIDTSRETRGFAIKFYTEEGNFDLTMLNVEMFLLKDPGFFTTFSHAFKPNPKTNLMDVNMVWDFLTSRPESLNTFQLIFSDRGIPDGYRYLPGFAIHTFEVVSNKNERKFVRFHVLPDAGIRTLTSEKAQNITGKDQDYAGRDLYNAIANSNYPTWTMKIQVATLEDVKNASFDLFDVTKKWPVKDYPLRPIGRLVLNKNPDNYFAQIEQLAFSPSNLVPGILGGVDKLFEARRLAYPDAQYYRLGANFNKIDVNCPFRALTYNRDGVPTVRDNERDIPNIYPNSFNGPIPYVDQNRQELLKVYTDPRATNFDQASELYANEMSEGEQLRLVANIVDSLNGTADFLKERAVELYTQINAELGSRIANCLLTNKK